MLPDFPPSASTPRTGVKGHPWPFIAGTPSSLAASMPAGPCMKKQSGASRCSFRRLGSEPPSEGRTQALRRGTRGMDAERGTKGQGCPFVTCSRSGTGVREVWARSGQTRMPGSPSLWLLSLGETRESDAPCKAQPVARAEESAVPDTNLHVTGGGKRYAVSTLRISSAAAPQRLINEAAPAPPNSAALVRLNHTCPRPVRR